MRPSFVSVVLLGSVLSFAPARGAARITVVNMNAPGVGFNDQTPVMPVGGNPGTTLGEQRLRAFQYAADLWGRTLDSDVEIFVQASFEPIFCAPGVAVLGFAGANQIFWGFPGAELPETLYPVPLANKLAGFDIWPGPHGTEADDILAVFNSQLDDPDCFGPSGWYYGFDNDHGFDSDVVDVLLHELGHGLGFESFVDVTNGEQPFERTDVFSAYIRDTSTGKLWNQMTNEERVVSATNSHHVVWDGLHVTEQAPAFLQAGLPILSVSSPVSIAGSFDVGTAAFGAPITFPGITGDVILADDGVGATSDGCTPLVNVAAITGRIALLDRGGCSFVIKTKIAQDAGAAAVLIADNQPSTPPDPLGGFDPTIVIPAARISLFDGFVIKSQLAGGVRATLGVDRTLLAGADRSGHVHLYAPNPVQEGSSISHWDPIATPSLLLEPIVNADHPQVLDLTLPHMLDIGWFSDADGVPDGMDRCLGSDRAPTVVVGSCDSHVPNAVSHDGCKISDAIGACADRTPNHGRFVSCVARKTIALKSQGQITAGQKGEIERCAARARIP